MDVTSPSLNAFVAKLVRMLANAEHDHIIQWSDDGNDILIWEKSSFEGIMPLYDFDTKNFQSFHRQLNQYGFKKSSGKGGIPIAFRHEMFTRDDPARWTSIVRSTPKTKRESLGKYREMVGELERDKEALEREKNEMMQRMKRIARMFDRLQDPNISADDRLRLGEEWAQMRPHIPLTPGSTPVSSPAYGPDVVKAEPPPTPDPGPVDFTVYPPESHFTSPHYYTAELSPNPEALLGIGSRDKAIGPDQLSDLFAGSLGFSDEAGMVNLLDQLLTPTFTPPDGS